MSGPAQQPRNRDDNPFTENRRFRVGLLGRFFKLFEFGGKSRPSGKKWLCFLGNVLRVGLLAFLQGLFTDRQQPLQIFVECSVVRRSTEEIAYDW